MKRNRGGFFGESRSKEIDCGIGRDQGPQSCTLNRSGDAKIPEAELRAEGGDECRAVPVGIGFNDRHDPGRSEVAMQEGDVVRQSPRIDLSPGSRRQTRRHYGRTRADEICPR